MLHPRDWSLPTALLPLPPRRPAADAAKSLMSDWRSAIQTKAYEGLRVLADAISSATRTCGPCSHRLRNQQAAVRYKPTLCPGNCWAGGHRDIALL